MGVNVLIHFVVRMILIGAIIILVFGTLGCYTPKRATKQWTKAYNQQRPTVNALTAQFYPTLEHTNTVTEIQKGDTVVTHDTTRVEVDGPAGKEWVTTIRERYIIHNTLNVTITNTVLNHAALDAARDTINIYRDRYNKANEKVASASTRANIFMWALIGLVILGVAAFLLKRFFPF